MRRADKSLRDDISDNGLCEDQVTEMILHLAQELGEAGDWIHRDIKPENILWCDGRWQTADFGVARAALAATSAGTLRDVLSAPYAAPEQWNREHATGSPRLRSLLSRMLAKPAVARPSIDQVVGHLTSIRNETKGCGPGGKRLAEVSAKVAEDTVKREAMKLAAQANAEERARLSAHALAVVRGIAEQLGAAISDIAPQTDIRRHDIGSHPTFEAPSRLRDAYDDCRTFHQHPYGDFSELGLGCDYGEIIQVECGDRKISVSLWLGDRRYRWYEVGYHSLQHWNGYRMPCSVPANKAAEIAADLRTNPNPIWKMAYKPRAIEGAESDNFRDRWMGLFA